MSNDFELNEIPESQEPFFDDIYPDFQNPEDESLESVLATQITSRGFDCLYKDYQRKECLKGTFYIHRGHLIKMDNEKSPDRLILLQNLSYARFHTISQQSFCDYRVAIYKNEALFELVFSKHEVFSSFVTEIRKICISSDFYKKYTVLKFVDDRKDSKTCIVESVLDGTKFTVKVLSKRLFTDAQNTNRKHTIVNQIEALRALKGCNVVELYEVHETKQNIYLVAEYSETDTLESLMDSLGSYHLLSKTVTQKIMFKILEILDIFASHGVIHRNIKPSNILVQDEYNIKIANLDLAICSSAPLPSLKICGTPGFMAPEMINFGKKGAQVYNEKCDVFAVGCIFFEMLFGYPIFEDFNLGSKSFNEITMEEIQEFVFDAAFERPKRANEECLDLLLGLLQYDPNKRISAQEALRHPFFNNLDIQNRPTDLKIHPLPVSPINVQGYANFTEAAHQREKEQGSHCEENVSTTDDGLDLNSKWKKLQKCTFEKSPSRISKMQTA